MTTPIQREAGQLLRLSDGEILPFIAATSGAVVVEVSTEWCLPCRWLRAIVRKLALEFCDRMSVVELDGNSADQFKRRYDVTSFPRMFFFRNGQFVQRHIGFNGKPEDIRRIFAEFVGVPTEDSAAELAFRSACARANDTFTAIVTPASEALEPYITAVTPALDAFEVDLQKQLTSGLITSEQASQKRAAKYQRVYAPFQDKIDALRAAQNEAILAYEAQMRQAVERYSQMQVPAAAGDLVGSSCRSGDPSCGLPPGRSRV